MFVCLFNMEDKKLLEVKLNNLFLDGNKIFTNLPKFDRNTINKKFIGPQRGLDRGKTKSYPVYKMEEAKR